MSRSAIDLSAILDALKATQEGRRLRKNILRAWGAASIRTNLEYVLDLLEKLSEIDKQEEASRALVGQALFGHAIVLYCAATKYGSDGRSAIEVEKQLPRELKQIHREICDLRDSSIAHHGVGRGEFGSIWYQERAVWVKTDEFEDLNFPYIRTNYRGVVVQHLYELTHAALEIANSELLQRKLTLLDELRNASDPEIVALFVDNPFDPDVFFQGRRMSEMFWSRIDARESYGNSKATGAP